MPLQIENADRAVAQFTVPALTDINIATVRVTATGPNTGPQDVSMQLSPGDAVFASSPRAAGSTVGRSTASTWASRTSIDFCPQRLAGDACVGDCDLDHLVRVDELIVGVSMALGSSAFESCPAIDAGGDGRISINAIIGAVAAALHGCG